MRTPVVLSLSVLTQVVGNLLLSKGMKEAAAMAASYSDAPEGSEVTVAAQQGGETHLVKVTAAPKGRFKEWLI